MGKSIKNNFLYNILLNVSAIIFPFITAPYVSRVLEPDGVGLYNFANTYAGYFALVAVLGIPTYGVREVAKVRDNKDLLTQLMSQLLSIAFFVTAIVSIGYFLSIFFLDKLANDFLIFLVAGFAIYLAPFKIHWFYQGIEDFGFITKVTLVIRFLSIIGLFVFVRDKDDLIAYIALNVIGGVLADVWIYIKMLRLGVKPSITFKGLKKHISPLLILFVSTIAISIYTILDTIMLGFITTYDEVGFYTNAMQVSRLLLSVITSLSLVAVPRVSYYMQNKDIDNINKLMNKSFSVVSFLSVPASFGLLCIAHVFIPLFFGIKFEGSVVPLMILSAIVVIVGLSNLTGMQILIGMGYDKLFLYSILVGTVSNFLLNCFLIPLWGARGASVASVLAEMLILIVTTINVYRYTPIRINEWHDLLKAFFGGLSFIPLIYILSMIFDGWFLIIAFVLFAALFYFGIEHMFHNKSLDLFMNFVYEKYNNVVVSFIKSSRK